MRGVPNKAGVKGGADQGRHIEHVPAAGPSRGQRLAAGWRCGCANAEPEPSNGPEGLQARSHGPKHGPLSQDPWWACLRYHSFFPKWETAAAGGRERPHIGAHAPHIKQNAQPGQGQLRATLGWARPAAWGPLHTHVKHRAIKASRGKGKLQRPGGQAPRQGLPQQAAGDTKQRAYS